MDYLGTFLPNLLKKTKVSLFIDPDFEQIYASKKLGVHAVELHTGIYSNLFRENKHHPELTRINPTIAIKLNKNPTTPPKKFATKDPTTTVINR